VKFEGRTAKVANGKLSDTFAPLARHVYVADILPQAPKAD
jgi:hypothetical protein